MTISDLPYRSCVGIALFNAKGEVFVGQRRGGPEHVDALHRWQMPQGGIDEGEDPLAAARRELYEETNVQSAVYLDEVAEWLSYDIPAEILGQSWKGKYRGQRQKWFAFRFSGADSEINIHSPARGQHRPEFTAWKWEALSVVPQLIVPFKRGVYDEVVRIFSAYAGS